jgi:hypothetical protein
MAFRQLPRACRAFASVLRDDLFLNLPAAQREAAACDLDDASLVKWVRWALAASGRFYRKDAQRRERELSEVMTQHGVIALALLTLKTNSTRATFDVGGVTYRGEEKGDWRVTIERTAEPGSDGSRMGETRSGSIGAADDSAGRQAPAETSPDRNAGEI